MSNFTDSNGNPAIVDPQNSEAIAYLTDASEFDIANDIANAIEDHTMYGGAVYLTTDGPEMGTRILHVTLTDGYTRTRAFKVQVRETTYDTE